MKLEEPTTSVIMNKRNLWNDIISMGQHPDPVEWSMSTEGEKEGEGSIISPDHQGWQMRSPLPSKGISDIMAKAKSSVISCSFNEEDTLEEISDVDDDKENSKRMNKIKEEENANAKSNTGSSLGSLLVPEMRHFSLSPPKRKTHAAAASASGDNFGKLSMSHAGSTEASRHLAARRRREEKRQANVLQWLQQKQNKTSSSSSSRAPSLIVAYSADAAASAAPTRSAALQAALASNVSDATTSSQQQQCGGILVVTSKPLLEEWARVVDTCNGGLCRVVMYTAPVSKRRVMRIGLNSADVVVTTWDILKAKEILTTEQNRLHTLRWGSVLVDFGSSTGPTDKNQAGRAIQSLQLVDASSTSSGLKLGLVEAELDSVRGVGNPLIVHPYMRTVKALLDLSPATTTTDVFFDCRC